MFKLSFAIILQTMLVAPPFEQFICTYRRTICVQYLRILSSSFGEEDFQGLHQIFYVQIVFGY